MLEQYFTKPDTIDRICESWIGEPIQRYVAWLNENRYAVRTVIRRVQILMCFGEFAHSRSAKTLDELPEFVKSFSAHWVKIHGKGCTTKRALKQVTDEARNPVNQMLRLILPGCSSTVSRSTKPLPFKNLASGFFPYLKEERGLQITSIQQYQHGLRFFEVYLNRINVQQLSECVFRAKPATHSVPNLPPVPAETCHLFRLKPATPEFSRS